MGANLVTCNLVLPETDIEWDDIDVWLNEDHTDEISEAFTYIFPDENSEDKEEVVIRRIFADLKKLVTYRNESRNVDVAELLGRTVVIVGGMSWGEHPSDEYITLVNAWQFPTLMKRLRFE